MNPFSSTTKIEERLCISATMKGIPLGGSFELLPLCNMNCRMCYLRLSPEEMQKQGRLRTADEWLSLAEQAKREGLLFLLLTGGEPFLYPEFDYLYEKLSKMGFILTINTNGTLIDETYADMLRKHLPRRVNITLYASSDEGYGKLCGNPQGFTQTMRGIRLLKERKIPIKLNCSLTAENQQNLSAIQRIARELELPLETDTYMFPAGRKSVLGFDYESRMTPQEAAHKYIEVKREELSPEKFRELAKMMAACYHKKIVIEQEGVREPLACRAARSSFWINWKGQITPCVFMEQPGYDVFSDGFASAWESLKKERQNICLPAKCSVCEKREACPICAAAVLTETGGTEKAPEYVCAMTEEKLRLMNELVQSE